MKILGTGIDIIEVKRVKNQLENNNAFKKRVFTEGEIAYCEKKKRKFEHYAVRFAAKEAVWKAMGKGGIGLRSIEVKNKVSGRPEVYFKGRKIKEKVLISLSHCEDYAVAQAIIYKELSKKS